MSYRLLYAINPDRAGYKKLIDDALTHIASARVDSGTAITYTVGDIAAQITLRDHATDESLLTISMDAAEFDLERIEDMRIYCSVNAQSLTICRHKSDPNYGDAPALFHLWIHADGAVELVKNGSVLFDSSSDYIYKPDAETTAANNTAPRYAPSPSWSDLQSGAEKPTDVILGGSLGTDYKLLYVFEDDVGNRWDHDGDILQGYATFKAGDYEYLVAYRTLEPEPAIIPCLYHYRGNSTTDWPALAETYLRRVMPTSIDPVTLTYESNAYVQTPTIAAHGDSFVLRGIHKTNLMRLSVKTRAGTYYRDLYNSNGGANYYYGWLGKAAGIVQGNDLYNDYPFSGSSTNDRWFTENYATDDHDVVGATWTSDATALSNAEPYQLMLAGEGTGVWLSPDVALDLYDTITTSSGQQLIAVGKSYIAGSSSTRVILVDATLPFAAPEGEPTPPPSDPAEIDDATRIQLTNAGEAAFAGGLTEVELVGGSFALGDSNGVTATHDPARTQLINERHRFSAEEVRVDPNDASVLILDGSFYTADLAESFTARELGYFDQNGALLAWSPMTRWAMPKPETLTLLDRVKVTISIKHSAVVDITIALYPDSNVITGADLNQHRSQPDHPKSDAIDGTSSELFATEAAVGALNNEVMQLLTEFDTDVTSSFADMEAQFDQSLNDQTQTLQGELSAHAGSLDHPRTNSYTTNDSSLFATARALYELYRHTLGINQAWTDYTAARSAGVTYTNNTNRAIQVSIVCGNEAYFEVNNVQISKRSRDNNDWSCQAVIPPGHSYGITNSGANVTLWAELR